MVKRWGHDNPGSGFEHPAGNWVLYSDYQKVCEAWEELADLWRQEKALQLDPQPGLATWLEAKDRLHVKVDLALSQLRSQFLETEKTET